MVDEKRIEPDFVVAIVGASAFIISLASCAWMAFGFAEIPTALIPWLCCIYLAGPFICGASLVYLLWSRAKNL